MKKSKRKVAPKFYKSSRAVVEYRYATPDANGPVIRVADGVHVAPVISDQGAQDWADYQTWLAVPNTPDPYIPLYTSLRFHFTGEPLASAVAIVAVVAPMTIAANLQGAVGFANIPATDDATFTVEINSAGTVTPVGQFDCAAGYSDFTMSGAGGAMVAGDALVITAPDVVDATLADITFTIPGFAT